MPESMDIDYRSSDSEEEVDLDAFLTSIESKLRGPFSSLELTKTISTPALRSGTIATAATVTHASSSSKTCSAHQYLRRIARVLGRTDKLTQLRILISLLGLETQAFLQQNSDAPDDAERVENEIMRLLHQAQEAPLYDEWVRIISGLIQKRLSYRRSDTTTTEESASSQLGPEAKKIFDKTCKSILHRVNARIKQTEQFEHDSDDEDDHEYQYLAATADADPTLAPYYYSLLPPSILELALPEALEEQQYFCLNDSAEILSLDTKMEEQKALDEEEHATKATGPTDSTAVVGSENQNASDSVGASLSSGATNGAVSVANAAPTLLKQKQAIKKKSSMFLMPSRPQSRPGMAAGTRPMSAAGKTALHARKAGAAQALLRAKKGSLQQRSGNSGSGATGSSNLATLSRSMAERNSLQRSKMKIMDVAEVQDQFRKQQEADASSQSLQGKRKRTTEVSVSTTKVTKQTAVLEMSQDSTITSPPQGETVAAAAAAAALTAYQQTKSDLSAVNDGTSAEMQGPCLDDAQPLPRNEDMDLHQSSHHHRQQDWREMLQEKSNRLTPEDRTRIEQFFRRHFGSNERPSGAVKIKLHEERLPDRKETYYLELDYDSWTSKQSKKTKRYNA